MILFNSHHLPDSEFKQLGRQLLQDVIVPSYSLEGIEIYPNSQIHLLSLEIPF